MSPARPGVYDALVLGGGIAGATVAAHLCPYMKVALLEREPHLCMHASGRSAAMFVPSYGGPEAQALTAASEAYFLAAAAGVPALFRSRPVLHVAAPGQVERLSHLAMPPLNARPVDRREALTLAPILRAENLTAAMIEGRAGEIDVAALHAAYIRVARRHGLEVVTDVHHAGIDKVGGLWRVHCPDGARRAPVLVNATGAWADEVARAAGVQPLGLEPRLRTVVLVDPPAGATISDWPTVMAADGSYYFRPFQGRLLITGCDETPSPPCDAVAHPLGVAMAVDRFTKATRHPVGPRLAGRWAGLRTFAPGNVPRIGWDEEAAGFFWVAGLGGFGVQASPAIGRLAALGIRRSTADTPVSRSQLTLEPNIG